ncbi:MULTISPECIES: hypothetical protein [unclassified Variovorax]|uniref:hypothetical protein n=1 Tax=unclassified Variovorax TaxID=663243 RepID=UPI0013164B30|nr:MULTISPECIES: hypothetical protein [unclassified Variovorax]VTU42583.1 hypothetical protein H6P1_00227 [Variovorax sp. PBL-H6]VTU43829.1 hypothetical protein SRS16P1_00676 [Variovorax sp. SRS16]VTU43894.1 hypothetical protein E5P1_00669 [Variovorax sp. PBL-E5]
MTSQKNYNDPLSHHYLRGLLESNSADGLAGSALDIYRKGLDAVLQLPEGEHRENGLRALNAGLAAAARSNTAWNQNRDLKVQLATEQPALSEFNQVAAGIRYSLTELLKKFRAVYGQEVARGVDMSKTAWPWFEHELIVTEGGAEYRMRRLQKLIDAGELPQTVLETLPR